MAMCWDCGGELAVNGVCYHMNPDPERLRRATAAQPVSGVKTQEVLCPDCSAILEVVVDIEGVVRVLDATHRT